MEELNGRVAVVVGGGSGVGRGVALGLGAEGMRVVVADIDRASAEANHRPHR
jgi:NAD(P)-dependent dehydrogenase (short-subunit alcohol dehydrogenase family)